MIRAGLSRGVLFAAALALSGAAHAQTDPSNLAQRAIVQLEVAALSLQEAEGARDRVRALTATVKAYEEALAALRAGMRLAAQEERVLNAELANRDEDLARLLGALTAMERSTSPLLLLHPSGPLGSARAGMIASDIAPELQAQADALRAELQRLEEMRSLQRRASETLTNAMTGAQEARTALSQAMADRTDLPRRFTQDPERMQDLAETSATLDAFAAGLKALGPGIAAPADFETLKGSLPLPVDSLLLRGFGEADAAGIARPGLLLATRPGALVTAPAEGTVRYVGPLLDYGNVMVLEPSDGILLVLAGMGIVYGDAGEVVQAGDALGLMGEMPAGEFLAEAQESGGADRSETLYMELRQGEAPVDPAEWFATTSKD